MRVARRERSTLGVGRPSNLPRGRVNDFSTSPSTIRRQHGLVVKFGLRRRQGIATQMLRALIRELKGTGIRRIDTAVYKRNRHALGF